MALLARAQKVMRLANAPIPEAPKKTFEEIMKLSRGGGIIDGNASATHWRKVPYGKVVGQDYNNNVYMEDLTCQYGRHRWVVFADHDDYFDGALRVPPEWHGWLHHINETKGPEMESFKPAYVLKATGSETLTERPYAPKGSWKNAAPRKWNKYTAWNP
mmetsp:Transcript_16490/g.35870  ORF Transcript_16490/g.35870 Transcript_16490/m.35870 type:complete len:159 (-) Transcript_16490:253-729(-)|eukprot:CAMPEP_0118921216 /NCGR_PEP_ID=MMETSP1169-20130426/568_1 /TAXON_ID=36882 /ORGANISM="Pyramimonas obovata, Strain CCMP722" /LENGTH=158 /DNA_ID=CAMNT_0006861903 /DNA_START=54 /DNA_END=530 /DNA_ORIENTATION=+